MKNLLFILLVLSCFSANAQRIRFSDTTNVWRTLNITPDGTSSKGVYQYNSTRVFSGEKYSVFTGNAPLIREDTILGKIYIRHVSPPFGGIGDTLEHVFFNYNLRLNDTFLYEQDTFWWKHIVHSVDSVWMNNQSYKVWRMKCLSSHVPMGTACVSYTFIEGIGTTNHPLMNSFPAIFETCTQLRCFSNNGTSWPCSPTVPLPCAQGTFYPFQPVSQFDNRTSCTISLNVSDLSDSFQTMVYPNPIAPQSLLKIPRFTQNALFQVVDMTGVVVYQKKVFGGEEVPIGRIITRKGLYQYRIQDFKSTQIATGRFTLE